MRKTHLTAEDVNALQRTFNQRGRTAFYLHYYELTGNDQVLEQAKISTFSETLGGTAKVANERLVSQLEHYPKEGVIAFSQEIARDLLRTVRGDVLRGGSGVLSNLEVVERAHHVWDAKGIGSYFPGNAEIIIEKLSTTGFSGLSDFILSPGTFTAVVSFPEGLLSGSTQSDFTDVPYEVHRTADGAVEFIVDSSQNDKVVFVGGVADRRFPDYVPQSGASATAGFSTSIGNFIGNIGSGIADFFAGSSSGGTSQFMPRRGGGGFTRASTVTPSSVEGIIGQALEKQADSIVEKIIAKNPNMFQASVGRVLAQSTQRFGEALRKGRINDLEDAFTAVLRGKPGEVGIMYDIGNHVIGGLLEAALKEVFNKTRTSTFARESDRSVNVNNNFRQSRGQQAVELIRLLEKGKRNT